MQLTPKTTLVNVAGAEVSPRHFGEKEPKVGKQKSKRDVKNTSLVNVATDQALKVQDNVQPGLTFEWKRRKKTVLMPMSQRDLLKTHIAKTATVSI